MNTREQTINKIMKEIHGRLVPTFFWENHEPMKYWYDATKDAICVNCGYGKKIEAANEKLTKQYIRKLLEQIEDELIEKYHLVPPID